MFNELLKLVVNLVDKYTTKNNMNPMGPWDEKPYEKCHKLPPGHQTVWVKNSSTIPRRLEGPRNMTVFIGNQGKRRLVNIILGVENTVKNVKMAEIRKNSGF